MLLTRVWVCSSLVQLSDSPKWRVTAMNIWKRVHRWLFS